MVSREVSHAGQRVNAKDPDVPGGLEKRSIDKVP